MSNPSGESQPGSQRDCWFGHRVAILKEDYYTASVVDIAYFGDPVTRTARRQLVFFRKVPRQLNGNFDFNSLAGSMVFRNAEVAKLLEFFRDDDAAATTFSAEDRVPGDYRVVDANSSLAALIDLIESEGIDTDNLVGALAQRNDFGAVVAALAATEEGLPAAQGALIRRRRDLIAQLRRMAEDPSTTETQLQHAMGDAYWLFGGRYVGVARRDLVPLDQHDIPLLGADGSLHIVELKSPNVPNLVRKHRNHLIVGAEVHEATSQVINYLRTLDESGATLSTIYRNETGIEYDLRRLFGTVVIGHPAHVNHADNQSIEQTIRSYNAHLSRVEVMTYGTLLDTAERALEFEDAARAQPGHRA